MDNREFNMLKVCNPAMSPKTEKNRQFKNVGLK